MAKLQEIFNRIQELKKQMKLLSGGMKEALKNSTAYQDVVQKMEVLREKKKQIEAAVAEEFKGEVSKLEEKKVDLASEKELLNDAAISQLMKGETIEIKDEYDNKYEPTFKVDFKKE